MCPRVSFFEPTLYQIFSATMGAVWSSSKMTSRPFGNRYFSTFNSGICGWRSPACAGAAVRIAKQTAAQQPGRLDEKRSSCSVLFASTTLEGWHWLAFVALLLAHAGLKKCRNTL